MIRLVVAASAPDEDAIAQAAAALRAGKLVAFPTETVYGLGANALDVRAVGRIFEAKGRPPTNPLIVHVATVEDARTVVAAWPEAADRLAAACWPGPLTLVLPKAAAVPLEVTAGLLAVGVRIPAHPVALALLRAARLPVAAPSANRYTRISPTTADHVARGLGERVDVLLDGGPCTVGLESTVLDLCGPVPRVLRPGGLPVARLRELLGRVDLLDPAQHELSALPSPGLARRHYAPRARVVLIDDPDELVSVARREVAAGERVAVLALRPGAVAAAVHTVAMPSDPEAYGASLYAVLHDLDGQGVTRVLVEAPPSDERWLAVMDRLLRAAEPVT